jgi:hypothetical protein
MEKSQIDINDLQTIDNDRSDLFKWAITVLIGVCFTVIGIVYGFMNNSDASAMKSIDDLKSQQSINDSRFQNLEANVYLLCKSQRTDCIPPIK